MNELQKDEHDAMDGSINMKAEAQAWNLICLSRATTEQMRELDY